MLSADQQFKASSQRLREAVTKARDEKHREALAFNLERAAWAMIDLAQAWVFELRLGIPRKETESFDLLVTHGTIELDQGRRYKQLCEFRSLSARENERIDWAYLQSDLTAELELFLEWDERVAKRTRT